MSYSLNSLKAVTWGNIVRVIKGDTRSLDCGSCSYVVRIYLAPQLLYGNPSGPQAFTIFLAHETVKGKRERERERDTERVKGLGCRVRIPGDQQGVGEEILAMVGLGAKRSAIGIYSLPP